MSTEKQPVQIVIQSGPGSSKPTLDRLKEIFPSKIVTILSSLQIFLFILEVVIQVRVEGAISPNI